MIGRWKARWQAKQEDNLEAVALEAIEQGVLGPEGPGLRFGLRASTGGQSPAAGCFVVRLSQRGQPIASWERAFSDENGRLMLKMAAWDTGAEASTAVWLPYAALPAVVEGKVEFHAVLYSRDDRKMAEGTATVCLEPHAERLANSALGSLVEFWVHVSRQFGPLLPEAADFICETITEQFQLAERGVQSVKELLRQFELSPRERWKVLWNLDRYFEEAHHLFLLRNVFEVAEHCGHPVSQVTPYVLDVAGLLQVQRETVLEAARRAEADVAFGRLQLQADAPAHEVKRAFFRQALKWHPDRWQGASTEKRLRAETKMRQLNAARHTLCRLGYDIGRQAA